MELKHRSVRRRPYLSGRWHKVYPKKGRVLLHKGDIVIFKPDSLRSIITHVSTMLGCRLYRMRAATGAYFSAFGNELVLIKHCKILKPKLQPLRRIKLKLRYRPDPKWLPTNEGVKDEFEILNLKRDVLPSTKAGLRDSRNVSVKRRGRVHKKKRKATTRVSATQRNKPKRGGKGRKEKPAAAKQKRASRTRVLPRLRKTGRKERAPRVRVLTHKIANPSWALPPTRLLF